MASKKVKAYKAAIARSGRATELVTKGYNEDQPRDESGKWTSGGGEAGDHAAGRAAADEMHAGNQKLPLSVQHVLLQSQVMGAWREGKQTSDAYQRGFRERANEIRATLPPPKEGREPGSYQERIPSKAVGITGDQRSYINESMRAGGAKEIPEDAKVYVKGYPSRDEAELRIYQPDGTRILTANADLSGHGELDLQIHGASQAVSDAVSEHILTNEGASDPGILHMLYDSVTASGHRP